MFLRNAHLGIIIIGHEGPWFTSLRKGGAVLLLGCGGVSGGFSMEPHCLAVQPAAGPLCQGFGTCSITRFRGNPIVFNFHQAQGEAVQRGQWGKGSIIVTSDIQGRLLAVALNSLRSRGKLLSGLRMFLRNAHLGIIIIGHFPACLEGKHPPPQAGVGGGRGGRDGGVSGCLPGGLP